MERTKYIDAQYQEHLKFWKNQVDQSSGKFVFTSSKAEKQNQSTASFSKQLSSELAEHINWMIKQSEDGIFVVFLSSLQILLSRLSMQQEVIIDSPMRKSEQEDVNSLFFMHHFSENQTLKEVLIANSSYYGSATKYQNLPVWVVDEQLSDDTLSNVELRYEALHPHPSKQTYDLSIAIKDKNNGFEIELTYKQSHFSENTISAFVNHWLGVLEQFKTVTQEVGSFSLLEPETLNSLLQTPQMQATYPDITIHQRFETIAQKFPSNCALKFGDKTHSYAELNQQANQLARYLSEQQHIKTGDFVALLLDRSDEMIVAMLAVLKAGAVYVPVDPDYPSDRIDFMISDSGSKLILTNSQLQASQIISQKEAVISLDQLDFTGFSSDPLNLEIDPESGAYVIYTSGSTGQPKGVLLSHKNVIRLLINSQFQFDFNEQDVWTVFHSFCFDFSVWEIYGAILYGGKCIVIPKEIAKDTNRFVKLVQAEKVTVLNQTPSAFYNFNFAAHDLNLYQFSLRYVIFGGEALQPLKLESWHKAHPKVKLINMYGITETCVHVTFKEITDTEITSGISNIGTCIPTLESFVLDQYLQPQAIGFPGELFVAGSGLAKKYLNLPELTTEKFLPHPFREGEKIYRTGDLAKQLPNGELEYMGRIDFQVKIRGFRIELGEIENHLLQIPEISEAHVLAKQSDEDQYLVAYLVSKAEKTPENSELKTNLSAFLPDYMIPSFFVFLDQIPLTGNGKVNRKKLPDPLHQAADKTPYEAPVTEHEQKLVSIWSELLNQEKIGKKHDFFRSGGHSLKATMLISKIRKEWDLELSLGEIFKAPVLENMALLIAEKNPGFTMLKPIEKRAFYPLSASQKRMFILDQFEDVGLAYNMPKAIVLRGEIQVEKIKKALILLSERHDALRTSFGFQDGEPVQFISDEVDLDFEEKTAIGSSFETLFRSFIRPFQLDKAPLLRAQLVQFEESSSYFFFDTHHIISDFISKDILATDFIDFYNDKPKAPLRIQYRDFAVWQQSEEAQNRLQIQENYWLKRFENGYTTLDIPTDFQRPHLKKFDGGFHLFNLDKSSKLAFKQLAADHGATMFMTMLAVLNVFLAKYSNSSQVVVGTPNTGRSTSELDLCVGFFVNSLALLSNIDKEQSFDAYLKEFKTQLIEDFIHQDYPFELLVEKLNVKPDLSRNPIFDIMYTYLNNDQELVSLEGIKVEHPQLNLNVAKFDLLFAIIDRPDGLDCAFEYASSLYTAESIDRMSQHFESIANQIAQNPSIQIKDLVLITEKEKELIQEFNNNAVSFDFDKTVLHLFEEMVQRYPEQTALVFKEERLSYLEFDRRIKILADFLLKKNIQKGAYISIVSIPSNEMLIAQMAIMRIGAAFLPIDTKLPEERMKYMIENSNSEAILSYGYEQQISELQFRLEDIDWNSSTPVIERDLPQKDDVAYAIYTSGSTGLPKGVVVNHHSLVNMNNWNIRFYNYKPGIKSTKYSGLSFDASIAECFPCITSGGELHIIAEEIRLDLPQLVAYFNREKITLSFLPTKIVENLAQFDLPHLEKLLTGGEKLNKFTAGKNYTLYNNYGPTENTVDATCYLVDREYQNIPIGKPVDNCRTYIRELGTNNLVGIGVPGELCLTGDSLASGYLNQPELTASTFIPCPFEAQTNPKAIMYTTGDLCRFLPDGNIEYLGRIDKQVKVRGYRIELGEVEQQLKQLEGLQELIVGTREINDETILCAYIISERTDVEVIKEELQAFLPYYMIPTYFIHIDEIPMTPSGKKDMQKLGAIPIKAAQTNYVEASTETERIITEMWLEVLQIEKAGIYDNFFELGGNSLRVVKLLNLIGNKYPGVIQISHLFDYATISQIAQKIDQVNAPVNEPEENETRIIDF